MQRLTTLPYRLPRSTANLKFLFFYYYSPDSENAPTCVKNTCARCNESFALKIRVRRTKAGWFRNFLFDRKDELSTEFGDAAASVFRDFMANFLMPAPSGGDFKSGFINGENTSNTDGRSHTHIRTSVHPQTHTYICPGERLHC